MNKRDAINEILLSLNELPLDTEDAIEDIQLAVIIDKQLEITKKQVLSKGWYFNTITMSLYPNSDKKIIIPDTFLSVDDSGNNNEIVVRDWKLFDKDNLTFNFDNPIECIVVQDIEFDDIPHVFADHIVQVASLKAYINIIGNTEDVQVRREEIELSRLRVVRENARNIDGNILTNTFATSLMDRGSI